MEIAELKRTTAHLPPSLYPEFLVDWRSMLTEPDLEGGPVAESLVDACSPMAHCGGTALILDGDLVSSAGRYWDGYDTLAESAECSVATVERRMAGLKRAGLVTVRRRDHRPSVVSLTVPGIGDYDEWKQVRQDIAGGADSIRIAVTA